MTKREYLYKALLKSSVGDQKPRGSSTMHQAIKNSASSQVGFPSILCPNMSLIPPVCPTLPDWSIASRLHSL